jgi:preprotein translocase subunit SecF
MYGGFINEIRDFSVGEMNMARRKTVRTVSKVGPTCGCGMCHTWICGLFAFLFGLIKYLGYEWEYAFMAIGILIVLKSLIMCRK